MNLKTTLSGQSFFPHESPQKLIFMLHGYGDSAENFIHIATILDKLNFKVNYLALNAPSSIPNYSSGRQWFNLYPNGIYIDDAGPKEIKTIQSEILIVNKVLENTIRNVANKFKLSLRDCFLLGFSQGGMMTFEFGNYTLSPLGGLAILSGRIIKEDIVTNKSLLNTPIFISHGDNDNVLPIKVYYQACNFLKKNKISHESYKLEGDAHTISLNAITLLQKFINKNL
jgi:phospholipase/carboxylesterase